MKMKEMNRDMENRGIETKEEDEGKRFKKQVTPLLIGLKSNSPEVETAPASFTEAVNQIVYNPRGPDLIYINKCTANYHLLEPELTHCMGMSHVQ